MAVEVEYEVSVPLRGVVILNLILKTLFYTVPTMSFRPLTGSSNSKHSHLGFYRYAVAQL